MVSLNKSGTVKGLGWAHPGSQVVDRLTGSSGRLSITEEDLDGHRRLVSIRWVDGSESRVHVGRIRRPRPGERKAWKHRDRSLCP